MNIRLLFFPLSLIILVWSIIGITKPAWDEYKLQKSEMRKIVQEKKDLEIGVLNIKKALTEYRSLNGGTKLYVNNAIPIDGDDDNLVAELNKNISQSGVLVTNIGANKKEVRVSSKCRQQSTEKSGLSCAVGASTTNVSLAVIGLYPAIKKFLDKLDVQNRIVVPKSISLATSNNNKEKEDSDIKLVTAKINFDVFQKKPVKIKSFSSIMSTDAVLKSLLQGGLSTDGLSAVEEFITSEVFLPVQVEGTGKDNLFEKSTETQVQEVVADEELTI